MSEGYMRRTFNTTIIIICVLVLGVVVFAQKKKGETDPCKDPMTQFDMNFCSRRDYEKADAELNKVYKKLTLELAGFTNDLRPKFQEAQSLWLKYRDANCDSESSIYEGGSIRPTIYYSCLASVTRERTKRIKAFLADLK
jgi:uncharacterized protein YecT (DUF1311 family)